MGGKIRSKQLAQDGATPGQVLTYVLGEGPDATDQWMPQDLPGGGLPLFFGADFSNMSSMGHYASVNGTAVSADPVALDPHTEAICPSGGTLSKIAWNTEEGDTDTVMKIVIDGVVPAGGTINLTGLSGVLPLSIPVSEGDLVALEFDNGSPPKQSTWVLVVR